MKAVCISNFNYYDKRIKPVEDYLTQQGYDVTYITGDYDTMNRQLYTLQQHNVIQERLIQYHKNISFERLYSHYDFAKKVYRHLKRIKPDVIYTMVPPNVVSFMVAKYKRQHPNTHVICDVFDMWPETFPSKKKALLSAPFAVWKKLRTIGLNSADVIVTECQLFADYLSRQHAQDKMVCYPKQYAQSMSIDYTVSTDDEIGLCYLGSINNIIDIPKIVDTIHQMSRVKKVNLHVVGNGEKKAEFLREVSPFCHRVYDHGNVYDPIAKQAIFNQCAFGINVLKSTVFIGLTLKTIDYFNGGLPLLNTVVGDTQTFIERFGVGVNVHHEVDIVERIGALDKEVVLMMKKQARQVFEEYFDMRHTQTDLERIFKKLNKN